MRNLWQKFLLERKKNGQIKKMVSIRRLILSYTMQRVIPNICAKFQNLRCSSFWEIFDTNFPMYYIGVRDGKMQTHYYWKDNIPPIYFVCRGYNNGERNCFHRIGHKKMPKRIGFMISTIIIRIFVKDKMTKTGTADLLKCTSKIYF